MTVADRIKDKRIELNMTQKELSDKIGTKDRSSISKIESRGNDISMKDIIRIAEALGVSPQYLLGWEDDGIPTVIRKYKPKQTEDSANVEKALELYQKYQSAIPEVKAAIEALLKSVPRQT